MASSNNVFNTLFFFSGFCDLTGQFCFMECHCGLSGRFRMCSLKCLTAGAGCCPGAQMEPEGSRSSFTWACLCSHWDFLAVWRLGSMEDPFKRTGPSVQACIKPLLHRSCECPVDQSWSRGQVQPHCGWRRTKV